MEYRYAKSKNVPIVAFIHSDPGNISLDRSEKGDIGRKKLEVFRKYVSKGKYAIDSETIIKIQNLYEENIEIKNNIAEKNKREELVQGNDDVGVVFNILEDAMG